jgi:hypothetical protein
MSVGGGGSAPSSQTQAQQGPSPYVQPYIEDTLGRAYALSTQPYQQYGGQIVAGASPLQTSAFGQIASQGRPPQFAMGTELAEAGGKGMLTTPEKALQYGLSGANYGQAAANLGLTGVTAGSRYAEMATNPESQKAYMSPYMQDVVDYQKSEAIRDFAKQTPALKAQAVGQGAYGGSRQAIVQSEAQRALNSQLQGIEATGRQSAYDRAVQQQQFGAQLGLQGIQTGMQGQQLGMQGAGVGLAGVGGAQAGYAGATQAGGTLGNIGAQQGQYDLNRLALMLQAGQQQRGISQDALTSQYQQFQNQLNYPYQQLAYMQGMYSGLPMTSASSTMYQGAPTSAQLGLGTLGTASSLYGAYRGGYKDGGEVKAYKYGGAIPEQKLAGMAQNLSVEQLQERLKDPQLTPGERQVFAEALAEKQQQESRMGGIAAAGGEMFNSMGMAGGGIIAFAEPNEDNNYSLVQDPEAAVGMIKSPGYGRTVSSFGDILGMLGTEHEWQKALRLKQHGVEYNPPEGYDKRGVPIKKEAAVKEAAKEESKAAETPAPQVQKGIVPSSGAPGAGSGDGYINTPFGPQMQTPGLKDTFAQRQALLKEAGVEQGGGERFKNLMGLYEQREAGAGEANKQDMFLRMAQSFAKAGSTFKPGGAAQAFLEEAGNFAGGEAQARKANAAAALENTKAMAALEEGRRKEAIGDVDSAEKFYQTAESHMIQRNNALTQANATIKAAEIHAAATRSAAHRPYEREQIAKGLMAQDPKLTYKQAVQEATSLMTTSDETKAMDLKKSAAIEAGKLIAPGGAMYKQFRDLQKQSPEAAQQFYGQLIQNQYNSMTSGGALAVGGGGNLVQNKDGSFNYVPR